MEFTPKKKESPRIWNTGVVFLTHKKASQVYTSQISELEVAQVLHTRPPTSKLKKKRVGEKSSLAIEKSQPHSRSLFSVRWKIVRCQTGNGALSNSHYHEFSPPPRGGWMCFSASCVVGHHRHPSIPLPTTRFYRDPTIYRFLLLHPSLTPSLPGTMFPILFPPNFYSLAYTRTNTSSSYVHQYFISYICASLALCTLYPSEYNKLKKFSVSICEWAFFAWYAIYW